MWRHASLAVVAAAWFPLLVASESKWDVKLYHTCLTFDGNSGLCERWQMYGRLKLGSYWECFPPDAKLIGEHGLISMAEASIGDKVLAYDDKTGSPSFSPIRGWLHRDPLRSLFMVDIHMSDGSRLTASSGHLLAISCREYSNISSHASRAKPSSKCSGSAGIRYVQASTLEAGDALVSANKTAAAIVDKVTTREVEGLYSPFTWQTNFFVLASQNGASETGSASHPQAVLAHSFTDLDNPQSYETAWHLFLSGLETVWPSVHSIQESLSDGVYVHPVMRVLRRAFGQAPMDDIVFKRILAKQDDEIVVESIDEEDTEGRRLGSSGGSHGSTDSRLGFLSILQTAHLPPFLANSQAVKPDPPLGSFQRDEINGDIADDDDDDENWDLHYTWLWGLLGLCFLMSLFFFCIALAASQSKNRARIPPVTPSYPPPYSEVNDPQYPLAQNPDPYEYPGDNMPDDPTDYYYYNNPGYYPPPVYYGPQPPPPSYYY